MANVTPKINEDLFGTKIFTVVFTMRDDMDFVDELNAGVFEVTATGGAAIVGNGTWEVTIQGTQPQVNTAMSNLNYVPSADWTTTRGVKYNQTDDNGDGTPGSNPYNDFMLMTIRDTHAEWQAPAQVIQTYDEDDHATFDFGQITDLRPDNIDPSIQYRIDVQLSDVAAGDLTAFSNLGSGLFRITDTKDVVNPILAANPFTPAADYSNSFTIGYKQTQLTDNIIQEDIPAIVTVNVGATHDNFNVINGTTIVSSSTSIGFGQITDLRPDNIDPAIEYEMKFTFSSVVGILPNWTQVSPSVFTYTGTKIQCNNELDSVLFNKFVAVFDDFTMTYEQTQLTDGVNQGSQIVNILNETTTNIITITGNTVASGTKQENKTFGLSKNGTCFVLDADNNTIHSQDYINIYRYDAGNLTYNLEKSFTSQEAQQGQFENTSANMAHMSADGRNIIVSWIGSDIGASSETAAWRNNNLTSANWQYRQLRKTVSTPAFGATSPNGNYISERNNVYRWNGVSWTEQTSNIAFEFEARMSDDAEKLSQLRNGQIEIGLKQNNWAVSSTIQNTIDPYISEDGNRIASGDEIYDWDGNDWVLVHTATLPGSPLGRICHLSPNGKYAVSIISGTGLSGVTVVEETENGWIQGTIDRPAPYTAIVPGYARVNDYGHVLFGVENNTDPITPNDSLPLYALLYIL